jgi:hypothetical protein
MQTVIGKSELTTFVLLVKVLRRMYDVRKIEENRNVPFLVILKARIIVLYI